MASTSQARHTAARSNLHALPRMITTRPKSIRVRLHWLLLALPGALAACTSGNASGDAAAAGGAPAVATERVQPAAAQAVSAPSTEPAALQAPIPGGCTQRAGEDRLPDAPQAFDHCGADADRDRAEALDGVEPAAAQPCTLTKQGAVVTLTGPGFSWSALLDHERDDGYTVGANQWRWVHASARKPAGLPGANALVVRYVVLPDDGRLLQAAAAAYRFSDTGGVDERELALCVRR